MASKPIIAFVILCFAFTYFKLAHADDDARIRELLHKSGIETALDHLPATLILGNSEARKKGLTNKTFDRAFDEAAQVAYASEAVIGRMAEGFGKLLNPEEVQILLRHYASPLGQRVTRMETESATTDPTDKLAYVRKAIVREAMTNSRRFQDRIALCRRLDEAAGTTDLSITVAMHTMIALQSAMTKAGVIRGESNINELKLRMEKTRPALRKQVSHENLISFLYAYRELSTNDLRLYLEFVQSPTGKKLMLAFNVTLDAALTERAGVLGDELMKNLTSLPL
jgi:hypothetical protein